MTPHACISHALTIEMHLSGFKKKEENHRLKPTSARAHPTKHYFIIDKAQSYNNLQSRVYDKLRSPSGKSGVRPLCIPSHVLPSKGPRRSMCLCLFSLPPVWLLQRKGPQRQMSSTTASMRRVSHLGIRRNCISADVRQILSWIRYQIITRWSIVSS